MALACDNDFLRPIIFVTLKSRWLNRSLIVASVVHQSYGESHDRKGVGSYSFTSFCEQCWQKYEIAHREREEKEK